MAKKKSTIGEAFGLLTTIVTRVIGKIKECGLEEAILGLSEDKLRELTDGFAKALIDAGSAAVGIFAIVCEGLKTSELVRRGNYNEGCVDRVITDKLFPAVPHASTTRKIELVSFDYDLILSGDVLKEFKRRGLERPTAEDALVFGTTHPEEQRKHPVAFLHEPVQVDGDRTVLVLDENENDCERRLSLDLFSREWTREYVFAGVRVAL